MKPPFRIGEKVVWDVTPHNNTDWLITFEENPNVANHNEIYTVKSIVTYDVYRGQKIKNNNTYYADLFKSAEPQIFHDHLEELVK